MSRAINHNPLGFVQPRAGGLPLRLTFFISPQDRVDVISKSFLTLTPAIISQENIGVSASIGIERSDQPQPLPVHPLISAPDGKEIPMTASNSVRLPAGFVLNLDTEMPLEMSKYQEIVAITGLSFTTEYTQPLLQLITKSSSENLLDSSNNRGLFVVSS